MNDTMTSPDGSLRVELSLSEWRNSLWVASPRVTDVRNGAVLLDLWGEDWDAAVDWVGTSAVRLALRRFTRAGNLSLLIDPPAGLFQADAEVGPLSALQASIGPAFERAHQLHLGKLPRSKRSHDGAQVSPNQVIHGLIGGPAVVAAGLLGIGYGIALALGMVVGNGDSWVAQRFGMAGVATASVVSGLVGIVGGFWMFSNGCRMFKAMRAYNRGER